MSDLHTSLVETYLHMRYDNSDSMEDIENLSEEKFEFIKRGGKTVKVRVQSDAERRKAKREEDRVNMIHSKGSTALAGEQQSGRGRSLRQANANAEKENKPESDTTPTTTRTRRLQSQATDPKKRTRPSLDDLLRSIQRESYSYSNWRRDLFELVDTDDTSTIAVGKKKK